MREISSVALQPTPRQPAPCILPLHLPSHPHPLIPPLTPPPSGAAAEPPVRVQRVISGDALHSEKTAPPNPSSPNVTQPLTPPPPCAAAEPPVWVQRVISGDGLNSHVRPLLIPHVIQPGVDLLLPGVVPGHFGAKGERLTLPEPDALLHGANEAERAEGKDPGLSVGAKAERLTLPEPDAFLHGAHEAERAESKDPGLSVGAKGERLALPEPDAFLHGANEAERAEGKGPGLSVGAKGERLALPEPDAFLQVHMRQRGQRAGIQDSVSEPKGNVCTSARAHEAESAEGCIYAYMPSTLDFKPHNASIMLGFIGHHHVLSACLPGMSCACTASHTMPHHQSLL